MSSQPSPTNVLDFLHIVERLKKTKRTGWVHNDVRQPESIADHMYRMSIMAMLIDDPQLKRDHCIKMCLVHDLAESIVGDITPYQGISNQEKHLKEAQAMERLCELVKGSAASEEMMALWQEYEACETAEARLVKDLDKFEMIVQALEYEQNKFKHPQVQQWVKALYARRAAPTPNH
ncbi:hypothetical protein IWQ62_003161 [Dispira parvispora]|uniref:5'-deoxynucleotidase n=1 Tax=Dispira parvispora TaxID=1520584 RepID=A0A9W8ASC2_9FUNG|nr:hypothetical protein IWQ62_003161 [Dispira parvispora]